MNHINYKTKSSELKRMGYIRQKRNGEFDLDNLPEGTYSFTGEEGVVKVQVHKDGNQSWDLENWFASLEPEINEEQRHQIVQEIKERLNRDTGIIGPPIKQNRNKFLKMFKSIVSNLKISKFN